MYNFHNAHCIMFMRTSTISSQSCHLSPLTTALKSSHGDLSLEPSPSSVSSTRSSGLALSTGVDTSVSSTLDSASRALDAGENVVGVVKLLSRGAGGGDAREDPVDCGETLHSASFRKFSKSNSARTSLVARGFVSPGWRVNSCPVEPEGRLGTKSLSGGGAMGIDGGAGGGGGEYGMPVKLYGENPLSPNGREGSGG